MELNIQNYLEQLLALKPYFTAKKYESLFVAHVRSLAMVFPDQAAAIAAGAGYAVPATQNKPARPSMVRVERMTPKHVRSTRKVMAGCETCEDNAIKVTDKQPLKKVVKAATIIELDKSAAFVGSQELDEIGAMLTKAGVTQPAPKKSKYGFEKLTDTELNTKLADLQISYTEFEKLVEKTAVNDPNYAALGSQLEAAYQELNAAKKEVKTRSKAKA